MPPGEIPVGLQQKNSAGRKVLCVLLSVVGGLALLGGGGLVANTLSNANQVITNRSGYGPVMWRNERADKLFPKSLGGSKSEPQASATDPKHAAWNRVGIAQKTGCADGLSGDLADEVRKRGCKAVLRSTYVDPTGNFVATVALIVRAEGDDEDESLRRFFDSGKHGVKAFAVDGTIAADWKDQNRNGSGGVQETGLYLPYDIAVTAGSVDGRKSGRLPAEWHNSNGKWDATPWREAAKALADTVSLHLDQLLGDVTS
ncbi:hypothetical protein DB35_27300 [Streptomyces abyssalis]|uniref:Uncharacterized protein n=1 Tax=Streptomyces abyssalis TaxID=933944 RepID=A0A1E7JJA7_9ACTN|nr:hypothetical protein [Streptomyces abyssalis]OEU87196.1 hypothetical protein DB35_27300 [Streptomyces abyssalis]OEU87730.1 hypothetical protein AN215_15405 [Streptomyces abyssalis]